MMARMDGVSQNTPEWIVARVGCVTASRCGDVLAKPKRGTGELACRANYRTEIVVELLTGRAAEHYVSPAMEWGLENENDAVDAYEIKLGVEAKEGGFWIHDRINRFAASPDRLIGDEGLLEAKCPTTQTHIEWVIAGVIPEDYKPQMLAQMACTGRKWCDFVSFDPRLPSFLRLFVRRFYRDETAIAELEAEVEKFLEEVGETMSLLAQAKKDEGNGQEEASNRSEGSVAQAEGVLSDTQERM